MPGGRLQRPGGHREQAGRPRMAQVFHAHSRSRPPVHRHRLGTCGGPWRNADPPGASRPDKYGFRLIQKAADATLWLVFAGDLHLNRDPSTIRRMGGFIVESLRSPQYPGGPSGPQDTCRRPGTEDGQALSRAPPTPWKRLLRQTTRAKPCPGMRSPTPPMPNGFWPSDASSSDTRRRHSSAAMTAPVSFETAAAVQSGSGMRNRPGGGGTSPGSIRCGCWCWWHWGLR